MTIAEIVLTCAVMVIAMAFSVHLKSQAKFLKSHAKFLKADEDLDREVGLRIEALRNDLNRLLQASGGFWKTERGDLLRLRDMTTHHLEACKRFASSTEEEKIDAELERRRIDAEYREKSEEAATRLRGIRDGRMRSQIFDRLSVDAIDWLREKGVSLP